MDIFGNSVPGVYGNIELNGGDIVGVGTLQYDELDPTVLEWKGPWNPINTPYYVRNLSTEEGWLGVANKTTSDHIAPQRSGEPYNVYGTDTITSTSETVKSLLMGQRYFFVNGKWITGYRVYTISGNRYTVFYVTTPETTPQYHQLISFEASESGWQSFNLNIIIQSNTTIDLVATVNEPDPTPTIQPLNYNYVPSTNTTAPLTGQITHSSKELNLLLVHKFDSDAIDRTAFLTSLTSGDIIVASSIEWSIQSSTDSGAHMTFTVAPAVQHTVSGVQSFDFETITPTPITYHQTIDHWIANSNISGFANWPADYGAIVLDNTQYGIDLNVQDASLSADWDLLSSSSVAIGGEEGGGGDVSSVITSNAVGALPMFDGTNGKVIKEAPIVYDGGVIDLGTISIGTDINGPLNVQEDMFINSGVNCDSLTHAFRTNRLWDSNIDALTNTQSGSIAYARDDEKFIGLTDENFTDVYETYQNNYPTNRMYSLRRLRSAYTGAAVQVVDSAGLNPTDIGFDTINYNLSLTEFNAFVASYGTPYVSIFYEQSGTSTSHMVQTTQAFRPILTYNSGFPEIVFDGIGQHLKNNTSANTLLINARNFIAVICRPPTTAASDQALIGTFQHYVENSYSMLLTPNLGFKYYINSTFPVADDTDRTDGKAHFVISHQDSQNINPSHQLRVNGSAKGFIHPSQPGGSQYADGFVLGATTTTKDTDLLSKYFAGSITEAVWLTHGTNAFTTNYGPIELSAKAYIGGGAIWHRFATASREGPLEVPTMTTTERDDVSALRGMVIYNTTQDDLNMYNGGGWSTLLAGGWEYHVDSVVSNIVVGVGATSQITIDSLDASTNVSQSIPQHSLFSANTFNPHKVGDCYILSIRLVAQTSVATAGRAVLSLDIGDGSPILIQNFTMSFLKGAGIDQNFDITFSIFTLDTALANGVKIVLLSETGITTISKRDILITRSHAAR